MTLGVRLRLPNSASPQRLGFTDALFADSKKV